MKKIININLSGRVIPIEDSAYEKLQAYIESLRRYFANEDGRDEIINDIESRIAELMNEKVRKGATCVTEADIDEIVSSMGRPEDFEAESEEKTSTSNSGAQQEQKEYYYTKSKGSGRLYRDTSDKFLGGVCSGMAAYLNVDPAIIRILFAIITFGGFGLGFLIYILLWIVLPTKDLEGYSGKRLYRNPEDRIIGGVAGGLAAYFNKDVKIVRLVFAAPIILSAIIGVINGVTWHTDFGFFPNIVFGSLSSTFILAYIVLWIVLPEARSTYERMEMRGEKVDVNSIRQNVKDEMGSMKDRMKNWSEEVKESAQNLGNRAKEFANTRGKTFATEVGETARHGGRGLGHAIGVLFKVFFLFIAGTIAFALFVALMALLFGGIAWWPVNNFLWTSKWQQLYAWGTLIFFLLVPLIGLIIWVVRRVMRVRSRSSYLGWTFGCLWTIGWVSAILLAASITRDFREYEHADTVVQVNQPTHGRMIVAVTEPELEYTGRFGWMNDEGTGWDLSSDTVKLSTIRFKVEKSIDSEYHVIMRKYSFGSSEEEAHERAMRIQYSLYSRDSILDLGNGYSIDKIAKFRGQQVEIEIQIPIGKKLRFDESVDDKLNPTSFKVRRMNRRNRGINYEFDDNDSYRFHSGVDYIMTSTGLKDPGGRTLDNSSYRYRSDETDTINVKEQIEEQKRQREESDRRIKELEEKIKDKQSAPGASETMDSEGDDVTSSDAPSVLSVVRWL